MSNHEKLRVLFVCVGNSARSQMAEGWARALRPDLEAESAGAAPKGLDPRAVAVMKEAGVEISGQRSKHIDEFRGQTFDLVVTLCAEGACPIFPGAGRVVHHEFDDPVALGNRSASDDEALDHFRRVRDQIRGFVLSLTAQTEVGPGFFLQIGDHS